jgi:hypothetical protein
MSSFYDKPGEFGYAIHGQEYGFDRLSFVLTETQPNGGPPLHTHTVEEGHVVLGGTVTYVIGDRQVVAEGPYIARVPPRRAAYVHQLRDRASERDRNISQQAARLHRSGAESTRETSVTEPAALGGPCAGEH